MTPLITRSILFLVFLVDCSNAIADGVVPFCQAVVWHASEETSSIWSSVAKTSGSERSFSAENTDFDWNAGFRFGFSHQSEQHAWDARVFWTSYRTSAFAVCRAGNHAVVPEFFSSFVSGDAGFFDRARLDWKLHFNTIDFELGHVIAVSETATLRPSVGLKAAFIDQDILAEWNSTFGPNATERVNHDFRGIGPSFAIDGRWSFPYCQDLSLIGSVSSALLWGVWNIEDTYARTDLEYPLLAYGSFTTSMKDSSLGTVQLNWFLGLEWTAHGQVTVAGRLGYELQWWANQQRLTTFQQLPMHGDLTIQGFSCGISVGF